MTKKEIRQSFLKFRRELSQQNYEILNKKILKLFLDNFNLEGLNVHTYLPIKKNKEVDTFQIIENYLLKKINWIVPKTDFERNTLTHYLFEGVSQLETNHYGIPEPMNGRLISEELFDVVLVPLLAFDMKGYRVGYGKGFYDRFLSNCRTQSEFIGLSFYDPVDRISDVREFDVPLNYVVTPNDVHSFS